MTDDSESYRVALHKIFAEMKAPELPILHALIQFCTTKALQAQHSQVVFNLKDYPQVFFSKLHVPITSQAVDRFVDIHQLHSGLANPSQFWIEFAHMVK